MPCLVAQQLAKGKQVPNGWLPGYCEWCGRTHQNRLPCLERYERSAAAVRRWLAGMTDEDEP
jgi:hypothetical protein